MTFVRALFANKAESEDELSFRKDDILEVVEQDYDGMEGWWLCSLNGNKGIAPANRLIVISSNDNQYDYDCPKANYDIEDGNIISLPEKMRPKTEELVCCDYDIPPQLASIRNRRPHTTEYLSTEDYDVPAESKLLNIHFEGKTKETPVCEESNEIINNIPKNMLNINQEIDDDTFVSQLDKRSNFDVNLQRNMDCESTEPNLKNMHYKLLNDIDYDTPLSDKRNTSFNNLNNRYTHNKVSGALYGEDYDMPRSNLKAINGHSNKSRCNNLFQDHDIVTESSYISTNMFTNKSSIIHQDYDRPQSKYLKNHQNYQNRFSDYSHQSLQNQDYDLPKQSTGKPRLDGKYRVQNGELQTDYDRPTSRLVLDEPRKSKKKKVPTATLR